jgi:hypothetical protein
VNLRGRGVKGGKEEEKEEGKGGGRDQVSWKCRREYREVIPGGGGERERERKKERERRRERKGGDR